MKKTALFSILAAFWFSAPAVAGDCAGFIRGRLHPADSPRGSSYREEVPVLSAMARSTTVADCTQAVLQPTIRTWFGSKHLGSSLKITEQDGSWTVFNPAQGKPVLEWDVFGELNQVYLIDKKLEIRFNDVLYNVTLNDNEAVLSFRVGIGPTEATKKGGCHSKTETCGVAVDCACPYL
jgi:hypothetical protein